VWNCDGQLVFGSVQLSSAQRRLSVRQEDQVKNLRLAENAQSATSRRYALRSDLVTTSASGLDPDVTPASAVPGASGGEGAWLAAGRGAAFGEAHIVR
jgi:K+-transporting ATPase c subunit